MKPSYILRLILLSLAIWGLSNLVCIKVINILLVTLAIWGILSGIVFLLACILIPDITNCSFKDLIYGTTGDSSYDELTPLLLTNWIFILLHKILLQYFKIEEWLDTKL